MSLQPAATRAGDLTALRRRAVGARAARPAGPPLNDRTRIRLRIPLTPVFWLFAPFAMLLAPLILLAPPFWGANPYATVYVLGRVLTSLGGTDINVDAPDALVRIRIL